MDFYADWCKPCKMMEPIIHELEEELATPFERVNIEEDHDNTERYSIMSIPTFVIIKDGEVVSRLVGYQDKHKLSEAITKYQ
jgi:thioredoxin 1